MATAPLSAPRPRLRSLACVWPLIPLRGSFLLAAHAYHAPPTGAPQIRGPHIAGPRARSEFVGCARILSTARSCCAPLSCETFRREPATRRFVWSFAPMPTSHHRVEHQNGSGPPPVFPPASASAGIVHRLSGSTAMTYRSPPASVISHVHLAITEGSLVRVPIRVRVLGYLHIFAVSPPTGVFSDFPRGTSTLSVSLLYLALDAPTTHSHCTTKQHYSIPALAPGLSPALALHSSRLLASRHNAHRLTTGALPCSVAPTTGIRVRFFSWPY